MRFTAAHELAHILFPEGLKSENLCHSFASAFLLPRAILKAELHNKRSQITFWELELIKMSYGISIQAILRRTRTLNIISEIQFQKMYKMMKNKGWLKREPVKYEGMDEPTRFNQLINYALTEDVFSRGRAAELANLPIAKLNNLFRE